MTYRATTVLLLAVLLSGASCDSPPATVSAGVAGLDDVFDTGTLQIETRDGQRHQIRIYLALEPEQQRRGLMFVRRMPDDTGMLFVYDDNAVHSMWMKNTYIPLDLVFAASDGTVKTIIHDTEPLSLRSLSSVVPVSLVLELNAGTARRLKLEKNSRIIWSPKRD